MLEQHGLTNYQPHLNIFRSLRRTEYACRAPATGMTLGTCAAEENDSQTICVVWSTANADGEQVFAWHADPELSPEAIVKSDEVPPQFGAATFIETCRE